MMNWLTQINLTFSTQSEFGSRPTNVLRDIKKEFAKYQEGHAKASRSNEELHKAMEAHIGNIRSLAGPLEELPAILPSNKDAESKCFVTIGTLIVEKLIKFWTYIFTTRDVACGTTILQLVTDPLWLGSRDN